MSGADWSLPELLADFHAKIEAELASARKLGHAVDKGDASEATWIDMLNHYLPERYQARKGHVVDAKGQFSLQIDLIIHDRQYSPFVFRLKDTDIVPAESVYAVFEAKQELTADNLAQARDKIGSVRRLDRTSLPVTTLDGLKAPKALHHILGGILTLASSWNPPLGDTLQGHLVADLGEGRLDLGCVASAGIFVHMKDADFSILESTKAATHFLFELIARLQDIGTVPMIDMRAYAGSIG